MRVGDQKGLLREGMHKPSPRWERSQPGEEWTRGLLGRGKSVCTAAMEKMVLIKTHGAYYMPGLLKMNPCNNPVR